MVAPKVFQGGLTPGMTTSGVYLCEREGRVFFYQQISCAHHPYPHGDCTRVLLIGGIWVDTSIISLANMSVRNTSVKHYILFQVSGMLVIGM